MIRLFVALRPPPAIRDLLADTMEGIGAARWQDDDQLHLTSRFVGEVERPVAEDLAVALSQVRATAPLVRIAGVGAFERRGRIDTLWADVAPRDALAELAKTVDRACVRVGLPPERRAYRPHITLARVSRGADAGTAIERWRTVHAALSSAAFVLPHLILYRSILTRGGAVYEPVHRWPLGTAAALTGSGEDVTGEKR